MTAIASHRTTGADLGAMMLDTVIDTLHPFRRKTPAKGIKGGLQLALTLAILWVPSGYVRHATGLDEVFLGFFHGLNGAFADLLQLVIRDEWGLLVSVGVGVGQLLLLALGIVTVAAWTLNCPNYLEATILSILSTYQGKVVSSMVEVAVTFSLPVSITSLLLCKGAATSLLILAVIGVQLAYLRWNIDASLARQYLARIVAIKGAFGPAGGDEASDEDASDSDEDGESESDEEN